jgi:hypothetical protein
MKIKDLPKDESLGGVRFKHPETAEICIWQSQWGYPDGKAGVWYKTDSASSKIFPLFLDNLQEALEFEVVDGK